MEAINQPVTAPNPDRRQSARRWTWLALGWLSLEYWALGPFSYIEFTDSADSHLPTILATAGLSGGSLWMPDFASGVDRLSQGLFPGLESLVFGLLPGWLATQVYAVGGIVAGGLGISLLARDVFRLSGLAAAVAGIFYATQQASSLGAIYASVFGFLPCLLWAMGRSLNHTSSIVRISGSAVLSLILAGLMVPQFLFPFGLVFALGWFILCDPIRTRQGWLTFIVCGVLIVIVRSQELAALFLNAATSHRADWVYLPDIDQTIRSIIGEFLGSGLRGPVYLWAVQLGAIACVMPILRRVGGIHKLGLLLFTTALIIMPAVLVVMQTALAQSAVSIKFFNYNFLHFYPFLPIPLALLMGLAINHWNRDRQLVAQMTALRSRQITTSGLVFAAIVLALVITSIDAKVRHGLKWMGTGNYVRNFESPILRDFAASTVDEMPYRVGFFDLPQGIAGAYGLETPSGYLNLYPDRYQDFFMGLMAPSFAADPEFERYVREWGNRLEFFRGSPPVTRNLAETFNLPLLALSNTRYLISRNELRGEGLELVRAADAPRAGLSLPARFWRSLKQNFSGYTELYIYENTDALPRAFIAPNVAGFDDKNALLEAIKRTDSVVLRATAFVLTSDGAIPASSHSKPGTVAFDVYEADEIVLKLDGSSTGVLVVTNTFSPYWVAEIDGKPASMFPVNHTFWGVNVALGDTVVRFRYKPPYRYLPFRF